jgi:hypothetical protein
MTSPQALLQQAKAQAAANRIKALLQAANTKLLEKIRNS